MGKVSLLRRLERLEQRLKIEPPKREATPPAGDVWEQFTDAEQQMILAVPVDALKRGDLDDVQAAVWARFEAACANVPTDPDPRLSILSDEEVEHVIENLQISLQFLERGAFEPEEVSDDSGDTPV